MAPSTASTLNPIVIPAVQVPPHFSTLGSGLLHETHPRESLSTLAALLLASPDIFPNKAKPKPWWRGQCLLYGLDAPQSLAIQSLREKLENALRRGELHIPDHLVELEHVENGKFRKLNAQVREATMGARKEGKGAGGAKKAKENPLMKVLGATKVAKKTSAAAGKTAVPAAAPKPRAKKRAGLGPESELEVKPRAKPRAKAQAPSLITATAGGNMQIYLTAFPPAPAPRAKQTAKRGTSSAPKPRAPKAKPASKPPATTTKRGGGGPGSRGGRGGRGSRGGARGGGAAHSIKHEASSPPAARGRTKQTARCSARGGLEGARGRGGWAHGGISTARVKEEEEAHDGYDGWNSGGGGGGYSDDDGYPYKSEYSGHSGYSDSEREGVKEEEVHDGHDGWNSGGGGGGYSDDDGYPYKSEYSGHSGYSDSEREGVKEEYDDEDRYYGYGYNTAL